MKMLDKKIFIKTISVIFILFLIFISLGKFIPEDQLVEKSLAQEGSCPEDMTDQECLDYLKDLAQDLSRERKSLQGKINGEELKQKNLTEKINYYKDQISARESEIREIEVELETKNVEIRILNKDIEALQDRIDLITQEVNQLNNTIGKRLKLSYKYSYLSPLEVLLSSEDVDGIVRRSKYLAEARKKDYEMLVDLSEKQDELDREQQALEDKEAEVRVKRDEIEEHKKELYAQKVELGNEKKEYDVLMAESKRLEDEYNAEISKLRAKQNEIDQQTTAMIMKMFNEGNLGDGTHVAKGQIIGFQGHTGCSYGSHLHFGMYGDPNRWWETNINPYSGHLGKSGGYLVSSAGHSPQDSAWITQNFHQGYALDTVSLTAGNQLQSEYGPCWNVETASTKQCYKVEKGSTLCGSTVTSTKWYSLRGEGAPIYSLYSGTVYYITDIYGARVALVEHDNGLFSLYAHLRK